MEISNDVIRRESKQYDPELVFSLRIEHYNLCVISGLDALINLKDLSLAHNCIDVIRGLECLVSLVRLDLSFNNISQVEALRVTNLTYLDLKGNKIADIENVVAELAEMKDLKTLHLKDVDGGSANPVCNMNNYVNRMSRDLPQLVVLDGGHIGLVEASEALEQHIANIKPDESILNSQLPTRSWFAEIELEVPSTVDDTNGAPATSSIKGAVDVAEQCTHMISEECTHLLRNASKAISKASTQQ